MTTVFKPGVFDLFHVGHLNSIRAAAAEGDRLVVGVHDDRDVAVQKGRPPVVPLAHRMEILSALSCVSEVVSYRDPFLGPLLARLGAAVLSVGDDYGDMPGQSETVAYCLANGVRVHRRHRTEGVSTTGLRHKVREFWDSRRPGGTMLGSFGGDGSVQADETERELELIRSFLTGDSTVLDLGAGDGRLSLPLLRHPKCLRLVAVEPSARLAARLAAHETPGGRLRVVRDAFDRLLDHGECGLFDLIILSGLFPCLDDEQARHAAALAADRLAYGGTVFVRTTVADAARIDVLNQYSSALDSFYTAYYRTRAETHALFAGFRCLDEGELYRNHPDTHVRYMIFQEA